MLREYSWDMTGYKPKSVPSTPDGGITRYMAERIFQLEPEPPKAENINDYILSALREKELKYFSFFLHHYENRLNGCVRRFLLREGLDRYDPERFLDYKMGCVLAMLDCLRGYNPAQGVDFLTYAHHFIGNALLTCRMQEEVGSFENVDEYKAVRGIAWLYNQSGQSAQAAIQKYAQKHNCSSETAAKFLALAKQNRSRVPFYQTVQDEDNEETGEDVTRDDSWNYAEILWNGIQAKAVTAALEQLSYKDQWYLEKRNAICMTCGRVSPLSAQSTFEDLAVDFEGTTASGAERFYRRTLDKLRLKLLESGVIHTVTLKQTECRKRNKKIAAAVYLYQADNDGEWGEIRFDFENGTAEIVKMADWDTVKSYVFAKAAIRFVQSLPETRLLKSTVVPFEMERWI